MINLDITTSNLDNFNLNLDLELPKMPKVQLYLHTRKSDNKVFYVGIGIGKRPYDINKRNEYWKRTAAKHGHNIHIVYDSLTWEEACDLEIKLIKYYRAVYGETLTNMTEGGEGTLGHTHTMSEEGKQRLRELGKGRIFSMSTRKKISEHHKGNTFSKGMKHSDETKEKLRKSSTGRKHTLESKQLMCEVQKKRSEVMGGTLPEETKIKLRKPKSEDAKKNMCKPKSKEHRENLSKAKIGHFVSEETRRKISAEHKNNPRPNPMQGKKHSDDTKRKMAESHKARVAPHSGLAYD